GRAPHRGAWHAGGLPASQGDGRGADRTDGDAERGALELRFCKLVRTKGPVARPGLFAAGRSPPPRWGRVGWGCWQALSSESEETSAPQVLFWRRRALTPIPALPPSRGKGAAAASVQNLPQADAERAAQRVQVVGLIGQRRVPQAVAHLQPLVEQVLDP